MTNISQRNHLITSLQTALENHPTPEDSLSTKAQALLAFLQNEQAPSPPITIPIKRLSNGSQGQPLYQTLAPLFSQCQNIDIIASFVRLSGVNLIKQRIRNTILRGGTCRILTGDYLGITQPEALFHLLNLKEELKLLSENTEDPIGALKVRIIETKQLQGRSFHPKAWIFDFGTHKQGFVGSSNLSHSALIDGIEWNLHLSQIEDPNGFTELVNSFQDLWQQAIPLQFSWIQDYQKNRPKHSVTAPEKEEIPQRIQIEPRPLQKEALEALHHHRSQGFQKGLLQMATGLGKTWLANFDIQAFQNEKGQKIKVLWIAHRTELLSQAAETFQRFDPSIPLSFFASSQSNLDGDIVFASIQKLSRSDLLSLFSPKAFDYIVIDEVHHAYAPSYQRVLAFFQPQFLLGLTATPHRGDDVHVSILFDNKTVFKAGLKEGIETEALVPFHYHGLVDAIDYEPIPWRSGKFDKEKLLEAQQTQARFQQIWEAWNDYPADRTLLFCSTIEHADIMAEWLREKGVSAGAVHSGKRSLDREEAIEGLSSGRLQAVCTVDLFNEGVDIPEIERVMFLRPTSSRVILLQQLGRGLRVCTDIGKKQLIVIDFVGNHTVFVERMQNILDLGTGGKASIRELLEKEQQFDDWLPEGCMIDIELEVKDILSQLTKSAENLDSAYQQFKTETERIPSPQELLHKGYNPQTIPKYCTNWFFYVRENGDLSLDEGEILWEERSWFDSLWRAKMKQEEVDSLRQWCGQIDDGFAMEFTGQREGFASLEELSPKFRVEEDSITYNSKLQGAEIPLWKKMSLEILDYRLARFTKKRSASEAKGYIIKLNHNSGTPILKFGSRRKYPELPEGETKVRMPNKEVWVLKFMQIACNVAKPLGETQGKNQIARLLRTWFGEKAGHPGTSHQVHLFLDGEQWCLEPWE